MSDGPTLTEEKLIRAFERLGRQIANRRRKAVIAVYGGAGIMLTVDRARTTNDVDTVVQGAEHGEVMRAAIDVANEMGLPRHWLNDSVSVYTSTVSELRSSELKWYGDYPGGQ